MLARSLASERASSRPPALSLLIKPGDTRTRAFPGTNASPTAQGHNGQPRQVRIGGDERGEPSGAAGGAHRQGKGKKSRHMRQTPHRERPAIARIHTSIHTCSAFGKEKKERGGSFPRSPGEGPSHGPQTRWQVQKLCSPLLIQLGCLALPPPLPPCAHSYLH